MTKLSYEDWVDQVDRRVSAAVGLSVHDLADIPFHDLWHDGVSPAAAARDALANEGWEGE